ARQNNWLQRIRQLINIQDFHTLELRNLIQIEVVGDDLGLVDLGELDQLQVDFADVREIILHDLHIHRRHFLGPLQNVQSAPPTVALQTIRRVGNKLQFA